MSNSSTTTAKDKGVLGSDKPSSSRALVSVIIPVYNAAATVDQTLASVVGQTYAPIEIIVVDDGSPDQTAERVRKWMPKSDLRLITQVQNSGPAAARNAGLAAARGEYVAFLDSDDEWLPEKTERQARALGANPAASLCACDEYWIHPDGSVELTDASAAPSNSGPLAWKSLLARASIHTSSVMVRRAQALDLGGFNEKLLIGEDQDLWIRLAHAGEIVWVADPLVRVHSRAEGHMRRHADREEADLLPMIEGHVGHYRSELTPSECHAILGGRYAQAGQNHCNRGEWAAGAKLLLKAAAIGYRPLQSLLFIARGSPPAFWFRRRFLRVQNS